MPVRRGSGLRPARHPSPARLDPIWPAAHGAVPGFRIDHYPTALHLAGLGVLAFELSFPLLALTRAGRPWAAGLGLAFHAAAQAVLQIPFASLWLLYVVFLDPERVAAVVRRLFHRAGTLPPPAPRLPSIQRACAPTSIH
jgi:hypothetical protein